jgi:serine protease
MATASFVGTNTTTQGTWLGVFGALGYYKMETVSKTLVSSLPAGMTITVTGSPTTTASATGTTDVRDLQRVDGTTRDTVIWFSPSIFGYRITPADGTTRRLRVYLLDRAAGSRVQTMDVRDHGTNTLLDTRTASGYSNGVWYSWDVSGDIDLNVTFVSGTASNAVVSGLFFDTAQSAVIHSPGRIISGMPFGGFVTG